MISFGNGAGDLEPQQTFEETDITWNTHHKIRELFGYPHDPELFGEWLDWFYEKLTYSQQRTLRNTDLSTLDISTFPSPKESS